MRISKSFLSFLLIFGCMTASTTAFAASAPAQAEQTAPAADSSAPELELDVVPIQLTYYNEIEEVLRMRDATPEELKKLNISEQTAEEIANIDIEDAYYERAQLPEEQLRAYGYTDEQIAILKAYDGSAITADSPVVAAAASCTGTASKVSASTSKIAYKYTWTWSSAPVFMRTDKVATNWAAYNSSSSPIDVSNSQSTSVKYYWLSTGGYNITKTISTPTSSSFKGCSADITMQYAKERNGNADSIWAKSGSTTVTLTKSGSNISYIKFAASYGHAKIKLASISVSASGLSISFGPSINVQKLATVTKKLTSSGALTSI